MRADLPLTRGERAARSFSQHPTGPTRRGHVAGYHGRVLRLLALMYLAACAAEEVVEVGVLQGQIELPECVGVGREARVLVTTIGGGCVGLHSTEVEHLDEATVRLTPYDRESRGDNCTADIAYLQHEVDVTFDTPGMKTIVIRARRETMRGGRRAVDLAGHHPLHFRRRRRQPFPPLLHLVQ